MTIEKMLKEGRVLRFEATRDEVERAMEVARRDLSLAENIIGQSKDWCFSIAYNAVLQASRAYMFHSGYRPASAESHKNTFEFMKLSVPEEKK